MADDKEEAKPTVEEGERPEGKRKAVAKSSSRKGRRKTTRRTAKGAATTKPQRPYPRIAFNTALQIAQKIKELNGGNPWAPDDVAAAIGVGPRTTKFFYITTAARDFGFTIGTRDTERIELAPLGREIVYAPNPETEHKKKLEAFFKVDVFKKVFEHYRGSKLPEMKYLGNTLEREFNLPPAFHEEFLRLFKESSQQLGLDAATLPPTAVGQGQPSSGSATVVLAEPAAGGQSKRAFIIMPFTERNDNRPAGFFSEVLSSLVTPAVVEAGFAVETAKRQGSDVIQSTIINQLLDADLVVADLTDHNPNVLFELGLRMAEHKPVALIKSADTGRIFDVDNMLRVQEYSQNLWPTTLETDVPALTAHVKAAWESRNDGQSYIKILRRGVPPT
jgi:hypothetical protein